MTIRTQEGARRVYNATLRQYIRDFDGGGGFGWDWRTMYLNSPDTYFTLRGCAHLAETLPNRRA